MSQLTVLLDITCVWMKLVSTPKKTVHIQCQSQCKVHIYKLKGRFSNIQNQQ
jgi:hypothetical protein